MNHIVYLVIGFLVSVVIYLIIFKLRVNKLNQELAQLTTENELKASQIAALSDQKERSEGEKAKLQQDVITLTGQKERLNGEIDTLRKQLETEAANRSKELSTQLQIVQEQLKTGTEEILRQREESLLKSNQGNMDAIVNPLKESIKEMRSSMDAARESQARTSGELEKAIENVMKRGEEIGQQADKLASALRNNENNTQGQWGELILTELLEHEDLKKGIHYDVQTTLCDENGKILTNEETGKTMRTDVILHYPDNKDLIIDSKVSLTAFADYFEVESDEAKAECLQRHIASIKNHIKELTTKKYQNYIKPPHQSLDYVIMFVPNESALQLALSQDKSLWRNAFEQGVFITGEMNLMAVLRIIKLAWQQENMVEKQGRVFELADQIVDRIAAFTEHFERVKSQLDSANTAYDEAKKKLMAGPQNVLKPAHELVNLGAKVNKVKNQYNSKQMRQLPPLSESDSEDTINNNTIDNQ